MCSICSSPQAYRMRMCTPCWREYRQQQYHCTWSGCLRPVFALTLCRQHYRAWNVPCAVEDCNRMSYCRQVCAHHYRKKHFVPLNTCRLCPRPTYVDDTCFYHYTSRQCCACDKPVFSRQRCRRHYMQWYRGQRANSGSTAKMDANADTTNDNPANTSHNPEIQSSCTHSDI